MNLAWCPVCDKQNAFAYFDDENLYCSEACRKKDALSSSILDEMSYEFPRCSRKSRKPYQSPHNSSYNSPESSPMTSPKLYPSLYYTTPVTDSFSLKSISYSKSYKMSSSPSDLLLHGKLPSPSMANQRDFIIIHQIRQR